MRIVDWNMRHRAKSWDFLLDEIKPDIAFLQECAAPPSRVKPEEVIHHPIAFRDHRRPWGNALYAPGLGLQEITVDSPYTGCLVIGGVELLSGMEIALVNMYGLLEPSPDMNFKLVNAGTHRMLSDISFLLLGKTRPKYRHFILCGDMNQDRRMDEHKTFRRKGKRTTNIFFDRIEDFLLIDCLKDTYPEGVQTYHHASPESFPWQLDHMFASRKVFDVLEGVNVRDGEDIREMSDHNPIIAEFGLV